MTNLFLSENSSPARVRTVLFNKSVHLVPVMTTEELHNAPIKNPDIQKLRRIPEKSLYDPQGFPKRMLRFRIGFPDSAF
jgi:hypothetical protein